MLQEDLKGSVANIISSALHDERQYFFRDMKKFQESTALEISLTREEFQSVINNKLVEIAELQVYLMNVTENFQKVGEKILFKTFASMIEMAKAEVIKLVWSTSAQSTLTDHSEITHTS